MPERYAIYFAPPVTGELWHLAAIWLGRDAATGATLEADIGGLDPAHRAALTRSARRYGFHATLKAPMTLDARLTAGDLDRALRAWATANAPVELGRLVPAPLEGFLALVPAADNPALTAFAARLVADFDGFRAPVSEAERQRRHAASSLTPRQVELLERFGYPFVLEEFRFHMTLTDRLPPGDMASFRAAAESFLAPGLAENLLLDRLVLFHEPEPGAPFRRLRDYPLAGEAA